MPHPNNLRQAATPQRSIISAGPHGNGGGHAAGEHITPSARSVHGAAAHSSVHATPGSTARRLHGSAGGASHLGGGGRHGVEGAGRSEGPLGDVIGQIDNLVDQVNVLLLRK